MYLCHGENTLFCFWELPRCDITKCDNSCGFGEKSPLRWPRLGSAVDAQSAASWPGASLLSVRRAARPQLDPAGLQPADGDAAQVFLCKLWWSTTLPALLSMGLFKSYLDIVWKMPPFFGLIKVCFLSIAWFLQCASECPAERLSVFVFVPFCFSDAVWPGLTLFLAHDNRNFLQMWNSVCNSVTKFGSLLPAAFLTLIHPIILSFDYSGSFATGFIKLEKKT